MYLIEWMYDYKLVKEKNMKANNILETIGNTTHLRLGKLFPEHEVWIKLEKNNPGASIKDRIAYAMIEDAEKNNILKEICIEIKFVMSIYSYLKGLLL